MHNADYTELTMVSRCPYEGLDAWKCKIWFKPNSTVSAHLGIRDTWHTRFARPHAYVSTPSWVVVQHGAEAPFAYS